MKPFVKWAGGKRQILSRIKNYINDFTGEDVDKIEYTYIEPFLGGGAVFLDFSPKKAIINDLNTDLINAYRVIKSDKYLELIEKLKEHDREYRNDKDGYYYEVRAQDRNYDKWPQAYTDVERAARMIFLNRTCYNGLYRVNSKGEFNTPIGRYANPTICDEQNIKELHEYLSSNDIEITNDSYEKAIERAKAGDIIYIDPPYDYEDNDGFTKYQMSGFTFEDFKKLKECCDKALKKDAQVIISNNATSKVLKLFEEDPSYIINYFPEIFSTLRTINCNGDARKTGKEVIIWGAMTNIPLPQANSLEKVIKLALINEEDRKDLEKVAEILEVSSSRQVSYYTSALMYLKLCNRNKEIIEDKKDICKDRNLLEKYIYERLLNDELFKNNFIKLEKDNELNVNEVLMNIHNNKFSEATLKRRASTIVKWCNWMLEYKKDNINE